MRSRLTKSSGQVINSPGPREINSKWSNIVARRNQNRIFTPPGPGDPWGNLLAGMGNIAADYAFGRFSKSMAQLFGSSGTSVQEQIALNLSKAKLEKQEAELVKAKALSERQIRLLDIRIAEKELDIDRAQHAMESARVEVSQVQVPAIETAIKGALEVVADARGLTGSPEELEGYNQWLDSLQEGKVIVIDGGRGSGKTCLAGKVAEFANATFGLPVFWIGLPPEARKLLPIWVTLVNDPGQCAIGSIILCDEAGLEFSAALFNTSRNRFLGALLMIARQRHSSLIFCCQSTADIDLRILRSVDTFAFKRLSLNQVETERPSVRKRAARAVSIFEGLSKIESLETAYICDNNWEGVIKFSPPTFWSEDLSYVYAHKDLTEIKQQISRKRELQQTIVSETRQLEDASMDTQIMELQKQGYGQKKIAKTLGITEWRVRKVLNG